MNRARVILAHDYQPGHEVYRNLVEHDVDVIAAVSDGKTAIEAAKAHAPDLMLLDIEMPAIERFLGGTLGEETHAKNQAGFSHYARGPCIHEGGSGDRDRRLRY
jgi:CheY-like chemotaxis protein